MLTFAAPSDLTPTWLTGVPGNAPLLLQYASIEVGKACQISLYTDAPAEPNADILRDATCIQVASWVALGVDPSKGGTDMPGPVKSSTILSATVTRDTTAAAAQAVEAVKGLCDLATSLLQTAGLLYVPVPLGADPDDCLPTWGLDSPWPTWGYPGLAELPVDAGWPFQ